MFFNQDPKNLQPINFDIFYVISCVNIECMLRCICNTFIWCTRWIPIINISGAVLTLSYFYLHKPKYISCKGTS